MRLEARRGGPLSALGWLTRMRPGIGIRAGTESKCAIDWPRSLQGRLTAGTGAPRELLPPCAAAPAWTAKVGDAVFADAQTYGRTTARRLPEAQAILITIAIPPNPLDILLAW